MRVFILEDEILKYPRKQLLDVFQEFDVVYAASKPDAVLKWGDGNYDIVMLDHDMHGFYESSSVPNCGYAFCKWLVEQPTRINKKSLWILHSQNANGRLNMRKLLEEHGVFPIEYSFSDELIHCLIRGVKWTPDNIRSFIRFKDAQVKK